MLVYILFITAVLLNAYAVWMECKAAKKQTGWYQDWRRYRNVPAEQYPAWVIRNHYRHQDKR